MEGVESELVTVTQYMYQGSGTRTAWSCSPESLKHQPSQHTIQTDDCHKSNQGMTLLGTLRSPQGSERFSEGFKHPQLIFSQNAIPRFELIVRGLPLSHLSIGQSMGEQAEIP